MKPHPAITIVTPCLNRVETVAAAIESVRDQDFDAEVDHIIIDGGSTDGTLEVLARYPHLTVISERDKNLYDAINKGIGRARASIVGLLNTDDVYTPGALRKAAETLRTMPSTSMACGGADVVDRNGKLLLRYDTQSNRSLDPSDILLRVPIVNARFFRKEIFDRVGLFDTRYRIVADREFLFRAALAGERTTPIPGIVYRYGWHKGSITLGGKGRRKRIAEETMHMVEEWLSKGAALPGNATASLKRLHAQCVLTILAQELSQGKMGRAAATFRQAYHINQSWMWAACVALAWWVRRWPTYMQYRIRIADCGPK